MPKVSGPITTFAEGDIYSTGDANRLSLGFHSANSILERNQITLARRRGNYDPLVADIMPKPFFCSVRVGSIVTLYWLKNEPGTDFTTDSDWEAFTASPAETFLGFFIPVLATFVDGTGTKGQYYIASVAGNYNSGGGVISYAQYDKALYDGAKWQKVGSTSAIADWNTMINKPATFTPSAHNHTIDEVVDLQNQLDNKLDIAFIEDSVTGTPNRIPTSSAVTQFTYDRDAIDSKLSQLSTYGIKFSWANLTQQNSQVGQIYGDLGLRNDEQKVYKWSGTVWNYFFSLNTAGAQLTEDITSKVNVGNIVVGQVLSIGTLFTDFVKKLVIKITYPTYTQPSGSITLSGTSSIVEIGSIVDITINPFKNDGDSGGLDAYRLFRDNSMIFNNSSIVPYTEASSSIGLTPISYFGEMDFNDGAVKYDDDTPPQPYYPGRILSTTKTTNTITVSGGRNLFYDTSKSATTSSNIRAWSNTFLNPFTGYTFTINITAGATSVEFAYPATLRDVFKVLDNGTNLDIKGAFTLTTVSVEGANAFAGINYKVYRFQPVAPFSQNGSYTVTI